MDLPKRRQTESPLSIRQERSRRSTRPNRYKPFFLKLCPTLLHRQRQPPSSLRGNAAAPFFLGAVGFLCGGARLPGNPRRGRFLEPAMWIPIFSAVLLQIQDGPPFGTARNSPRAASRLAKSMVSSSCWSRSGRTTSCAIEIYRNPRSERSPVTLETVHNPIISRNGVGLFLWSAVSLKNMRMRFARVVAT